MGSFGRAIFGSNKTVQGTDPNTSKVRGDLANYFMGQPSQGNYASQLYSHPTMAQDSGSSQSAADITNSPFFTQMMQPYQAAFAQNRQLGLAQAKEGAGNLTGSGFANTLGNTVNRSLADENAQLAGVGQQHVQNEIYRQLQEHQLRQSLALANAGYANDSSQANAQRYAQLLGNFANTGVFAPQTMHQPGLIEDASHLAGTIFSAWNQRPGQQPQLPGGDGFPPGVSIPPYTPPPNIPPGFPQGAPSLGVPPTPNFYPPQYNPWSP